MAIEISRKHRPEHKDFEVIVEDDHGVRRPVYIVYGREDCPACGRAFAHDEQAKRDVNADVEAHIKTLEARADKEMEVLCAAGQCDYVDAMKARRQAHKDSSNLPAGAASATDCGCGPK